jgi:hypothetical protein
MRAAIHRRAHRGMPLLRRRRTDRVKRTAILHLRRTCRGKTPALLLPLRRHLGRSVPNRRHYRLPRRGRHSKRGLRNLLLLLLLLLRDLLDRRAVPIRRCTTATKSLLQPATIAGKTL